MKLVSINNEGREGKVEGLFEAEGDETWKDVAKALLDFGEKPVLETEAIEQVGEIAEALGMTDGLRRGAFSVESIISRIAELDDFYKRNKWKERDLHIATDGNRQIRKALGLSPDVTNDIVIDRIAELMRADSNLLSGSPYAGA